MKSLLNSYFLITRKKIPAYLKYYWSKITSEIKTKVEGIPPLILLKSLGKNLEDYLIFGNSIQGKLPNIYQQVEYIESTGTQYIDTGININATTSRYETKINPSLVTGTMGIFGTRNYTSSNLSSMNVFIINGAFRLDWLTGEGSYNVGNISSNTEYTISITRGLATINNVDYTSEATRSIDSLYPFYIGNFNNAGSVYSTGFSGKIYYSKLYNNNILVFDGVPCYRKSDNVAGMYDLVTNTFFTNAGTGEFLKGSNAPTPSNPIEIESVGDLVTDVNDDNYGKYKIPVKVKDTNNIVQSTINIYLDEPLRKIGEYSDYVDFENSKVVRNIAKKVLNGTENWTMPATIIPDYSSYRIINFIPNLPLQTPIEELLCTHFETFPKSQYQQEPIQNKVTSYGNTNQIIILVSNNIADSNNQTTTANWINWLSNHNVTLYYSKKQPTEESISLPNIPTIKGTTVIEIDTEIQPSKIEVEYLRGG